MSHFLELAEADWDDDALRPLVEARITAAAPATTPESAVRTPQTPRGEGSVDRRDTEGGL